MRKALVVAVREYQAAVKTKAFIISLLALPLIWGGSIAVQLFMRDKVDTKDKHIAILDYTGKLADAIEQEAAKRSELEIFRGEGPSRRQAAPRYVMERVAPVGDDPDQMTYELSQRVRREELMAFVVIGPAVLNAEDEGEQAGVSYYSNSPTYDDVYDWFRGPLNARVHQLRFGAVNLDPKVVDLAMRRVPCRNLGLVDKDALGQIVPAKETNELASIFAPMGLMMLMLMVVMVGATPLLQGVLEEKTNRIAEVLVGSVPPFQLMLGKLLGMVGVSLTIATFYLVGGFVAVHQAGLGHLFPTKLVWWFVVFQSLAVLMYGSLFIAIGAAVTDQKEAQSMMTPLMVVVMSPMFVWMNVVREPTSTLSLMLSLFPPATPMLMLVRQAVPPGIPLWQPALGIVLMVITTLVLVLAAGRIFRVGFLMQGKGARVGEMLRWVFHG